MDEIELTRRQVKGDRARELLESDTLKQAFGALHDELIDGWKRTPVRDTAARERLWQAIHIIGRVQEILARFVTDGKIAKSDLQRITALSKR